ncbi:MAG: anti-sigma factor family protein [Chitinophagaceae bacterium]
MELNRNNYEEYFLLYLDGELDAAGRNEVEAFLAANPDMAMEMDLLKTTILHAEQEEPIQFGDIDLLLKPEADAVINEQNFEPFLLSYIDNELSSEDKIRTEVFVSANTYAKETLQVLQRTKLQPDLSIVYPDKSELLKEEKTRKIVYFRWQYVAVAAAMMGIFVNLLLNKPVDNNTEQVPGMASNEKSTPATPADTNGTSIPDNTTNTTLAATTNPVAPSKATGTHVAQPKKQAIPAQEHLAESNTAFAVNEVSQVPKAFTDINNTIASNNTVEAPVTTITEKKGDMKLAAPAVTPGADALKATLAANQKLEMPEEEVLLIGSTRINKSSVRGILRKTGRFLERTANVGENKASRFINGKSDNKKD